MTPHCPVCENPAKISDRFSKKRPDTTDNLFIHISCPRCGDYFISDAVFEYTLSYFGNPSKRKLLNLSSSLHFHNKPYIHQHNIESLLQTKPASIEQRAYSLLKSIKNKTEFMGQLTPFNPDDLALQAETWSYNDYEILSLLDYWVSKSITKREDDTIGITVSITPEGWSYIEQNDKTNTNSIQGFIAMWFKPKMTKVYEQAIAPAIISAGYSPIRVDKHQHNNDITEEIIAQIRRSKFLVSDYTGHRGGVYYEAGFARGLGLEVFMTCRKDNMKYLHFDVRQRICIEWTEDNLPDLKKQLTDKIEAILGRGPHIHGTP